MPLNFPENPTVNQIYVYNGIRWRWNGYGWASLGICGGSVVVGGISGDYIAGITGGIGITVSGPTGIVEVTLRLDEPNIGTPYIAQTHNAPTTFSADSGPARKVAFLQEDGSIAFDFIKNYDVFRQAEFNFDINSFTINDGVSQLSPQLAKDPGSQLNLDPYSAFISYNYDTDINPSQAEIKLIGSLSGQGFPAVIDNPQINNYNFNNSQYLIYPTLSYNSVGEVDNQILILGATGQNSDGTIVYKTKQYKVYFYNYIFYGHSNLTSINSTNFSQLIPVLNGTKSYVISNYTIPQNDITPNFLYFAYPSRLGTAVFTDSSTGLQGGFQQQSGVYSYTNGPGGYTENYTIYRSEQPNLGTVTITVS